ncbi:MAG: NAD-dependent epimerase/dehydratase family protein [Deltaproteobacteria bacterium]|nr:NAD-dependent epimerase/dehydratase family protein [Deltaproteobacteria bacterium]
MRVLVTGGGGFIGGGLARRLAEAGEAVRTFSRGDYPELARLGVEQHRGDLGDPEAVARAVEGCELVFHVGAKAGVWGAAEDFHRANVLGTRNVLDACRRHGVRRLVFTSSPSVVFDGGDLEGIDESQPYPERYPSPYPETKAISEREVRAAASEGLMTVSLRPHSVWGPGDPHFVPRIVERARAGQLRQIGDDTKLVDSTYIDNVVDAHLLAAEKLGPELNGRVYFVSNGEPRPTWQLINAIAVAAGAPPIEKRVPRGLAYAAGSVVEGIWKTFGIASEPRMTRFLVKELTTAHWFDLSAIRRDLGYSPRISIDEGLRRLSVSTDRSSTR